jgi:hypothetical protein
LLFLLFICCFLPSHLQLSIVKTTTTDSCCVKWNVMKINIWRKIEATDKSYYFLKLDICGILMDFNHITFPPPHPLSRSLLHPLNRQKYFFLSLQSCRKIEKGNLGCYIELREVNVERNLVPIWHVWRNLWLSSGLWRTKEFHFSNFIQ